MHGVEVSQSLSRVAAGRPWVAESSYLAGCCRVRREPGSNRSAGPSSELSPRLGKTRESLARLLSFHSRCQLSAVRPRMEGVGTSHAAKRKCAKSSHPTAAYHAESAHAFRGGWGPPIPLSGARISEEVSTPDTHHLKDMWDGS